METIKNISIAPGSIVINFGESGTYDVVALHDALTKLPAEIYLKLYHKMQEKVLGYPPFYCGCNVVNTEEEKTE